MAYLCLQRKPKKPRKVIECKATKNPCKVCLKTVTPRNGLRCEGACRSSVHFKCLNYTPGKIRDIKAGSLIVTCPCPNCKTGAPKECPQSMPFTCNNTACPANNPASCENFDCIANEQSRCLPPLCPPPGTLNKCGKEICREYSSLFSYGTPSCQTTQECRSSSTYISQPALMRDSCLSASSCTPCSDDKKPPQRPDTQPTTFTNLPSPARNLGEEETERQAYRSTSENTMEVVRQMCKTVGDLADQLNDLLDHMK